MPFRSLFIFREAPKKIIMRSPLLRSRTSSEINRSYQYSAIGREAKPTCGPFASLRQFHHYKHCTRMEGHVVGQKEVMGPTADNDQEAQGLERDEERYLPNYSYIVKDGNGRWFELKCPTCGTNTAAGPFRKYLRGVAGFARHLEKHNVKIRDKPKGQWRNNVIMACLVREVSQFEVDYLLK